MDEDRGIVGSWDSVILYCLFYLVTLNWQWHRFQNNSLTTFPSMFLGTTYCTNFYLLDRKKSDVIVWNVFWSGHLIAHTWSSLVHYSPHPTLNKKTKKKRKKNKEHKGDRMRISFFFLFFRNRLPFEPYKIIHMHKVVSCMIYNHLNSEMT